MASKKYVQDLDHSEPQEGFSFIESKEISDIRAYVSDIKFSSDTRKSMQDNAECKFTVPRVEVLFETDTSCFKSLFKFDPIDFADYPKKNSFTSLVSSAHIEWDILDQIIGSEVTLISPYNEKSVLIQDPLKGHNYNILSQVDPSELYCDGISDYLIDVFVNWVHNKTHGYATIKDMDIQPSKRIQVIFELNSGDTFSTVLDVRRSENDETNRLQSWSTRKSETNRKYDFWDLCTDAIGYIPVDSNYSKILGEQVPVEYDARWKIQK